MNQRHFTYKILKFCDFFFQEIRANFIIFYHTGNLKFFNTVCHRNELAYQKDKMLTIIKVCHILKHFSYNRNLHYLRTIFTILYFLIVRHNLEQLINVVSTIFEHTLLFLV